jgi:hypothetical protein
MATRIGFLVLLGGVAVAGVVAPALVDDPGQLDAQCRAWLGSANDGVCIDGPSDPGPDFPTVGIGPTGEGPGISTSPLLPGDTINIPIPIG